MLLKNKIQPVAASSTIAYCSTSCETNTQRHIVTAQRNSEIQRIQLEPKERFEFGAATQRLRRVQRFVEPLLDRNVTKHVLCTNKQQKAGVQSNEANDCGW